MQEELSAEVEVLELLTVLQNVFEFDGRERHEINFIHHARFLDDSFTRRDEVPNIEPDSSEINVWLPVRELLGGSVPLYPAIDYPRILQDMGVPI
jgi:hypothetical protein